MSALTKQNTHIYILTHTIMKVIELFNTQEALNKLIKIEMPIKVAYELRKFIISADEKLKAFNTIREDLIKKY